MHLLISALSSASGPSGICRHAYNLVRSGILHDDITRVTIVVGSWQNDYFCNWLSTVSPMCRIISVDIRNNSIARNLWYAQKLPEIAKELRADIVHLAFPVPVVKSRFHCPLIVTLHDLYPYDYPQNFGFPNVIFNRAFFQQCLKSIDLLVCVSEETLSGLKNRMPRVAYRKSAVILNCVDVASARSANISDQSKTRIPFFLMVAQHRENKNIELVVEVLSKLIKEKEIREDTQLVVVGNNGPRTQWIMQQVNFLQLDANVKFMNSVGDDELFWLYENCEVLLAPSSVEGFCLPVVEALLCGARVVCSDIPIFREISGEACHFFDLHAPSPPAAMAIAIRTALLEEPRDMPRTERFSLNSVSDSYVSLYKRLTAAHE